MLVTSDELTYNIVNSQETDENIRNIKKLLPSSKTSEFILNDNVLFKISENQELLVFPEMMQVNVIKKAHSFRHFAATKTEELVRRDYYFPNMRKCVENVIKNADWPTGRCKRRMGEPTTENGKSSISERRVGSNREDSVWKQDEAMDFALMREEERTSYCYTERVLKSVRSSTKEQLVKVLENEEMQ
ncbi:transposon Tf2-9 polyprotein [Trichonephila clavipes]|nr:transposon Tf2-9 polyprotein [Trichonephila clavipes]